MFENTRDKDSSLADQVATTRVAMSFIASLVVLKDWSKMESEEMRMGKAYPDSKGVAIAKKCHLPENPVSTPIYEVSDSRFSARKTSLILMGM